MGHEENGLSLRCGPAAKDNHRSVIKSISIQSN